MYADVNNCHNYAGGAGMGRIYDQFQKTYRTSLYSTKDLVTKGVYTINILTTYFESFDKNIDELENIEN
jgi:hypothetical protein